MLMPTQASPAGHEPPQLPPKVRPHGIVVDVVVVVVVVMS